MESNVQDSQNPDPKPSSKQTPFTSITLSIPKHLPSFFIPPPQHPFPISKTHIQTLKIPSQISHLSLISSTPISRFATKSSLSAYPCHNPLNFNPTRPTDPSRAAGIRRVSVVWFRSDLRVLDNESLNTANNESLTVLPVFCFDPSEFSNSVSGFDKTGPNRASFLIESVSDLRNSLRAKGSDLVVRIGKPETVLRELVKAVGAEAVYVHREVANDEVKAEGKIENVLKDEGVEVKYFWGSTLYHVDDLPFALEDMPSTYGEFREKVKGLKVRNTIAVADQFKSLPSGGNVEAGEIPSLADLGINHTANMSQVKSVSSSSLIGGETEALNRIKRFAAECQANPPKETKDGSNDSIYGANYSCKISPWLTVGCVSPRTMFDELKKSASRMISASSNGKDGDGGMNWLIFVTKKYSSSKQRSIAPVTA
ncbi:blue-light photoreceptor PHR2 [Tanacetum coccineum]